jgi:hypothetical protein
MSSSGNAASLPYHEPGIVSILIVASFLLLLNVVNYILDKIVYCGLVGQLFIGIAWGIPGANWLSAELQQSIVQLGYIGLILIVYEGRKERRQHERTISSTNILPGGISSNLKALNANLFLSSAVALTGIGAPIGLSFILPVDWFSGIERLAQDQMGLPFPYRCLPRHSCQKRMGC